MREQAGILQAIALCKEVTQPAMMAEEL